MPATPSCSSATARRFDGVAWWLPLVAFATACAGASQGPRSPETALARWQTAIAADAPADAYALLSSGVRRGLPYEQFHTRWQSSHEERQVQARDLGGAEPVVQHAHLLLPGTDVVDLVRNGGGWRLSRALVSSRSPRTPEDAVRELARRLERDGLGSWAELATDCVREAQQARLERLVVGLSAHASETVTLSETRAVLAWRDDQDRFRVKLRRQGSDWRIEDVLLPPAPCPE